MAITSLAFLSAEKVRTKFPKAVSSAVALLAVIVLALVGATINRNSVWRDPVSLWEDAARKSPNKGRVHHDLGRAYDVRHAPLKAFEQYRLAVLVQPDLARAHESLGISLVSFGAITAARNELATALQLDPSLNDARMFLDFISKQQGRYSSH